LVRPVKKKYSLNLFCSFNFSAIKCA